MYPGFAPCSPDIPARRSTHPSSAEGCGTSCEPTGWNLTNYELETTPRAGDEYADLDESVDSFFTRRFGPDFARICGSAIVHGVYAADSRKLSVRAAVPFLHDLEISGRGSVVRGALWGALKKVFSQGGRKAEDFKEVQYDLGDVRRLMKDVSVYSFREGMGMLVSALEGALNQRDNVRIVKGDAVVGLRRRASEEQGFEVATASGMTIAPSHLVSSLPLPNLYALLQRSLSSPTSSSSAPLAVLPHLTANPSSSVTVVNLVFPSPPGARPLHPPGFGYLVPRPAAGYSTDGKYESRPDNPMGVLGTVFDSCALAEQDTDSAGRPAPVTKMTVMLGGPYSSSPEPDVDSLLHHLSVHLSPSPSPEPLGAPLIAQIHRHTSCIPTPTVGHVARMAELREAVRREWGGCAEVIGAGVGGVSVNACAEMGKTVGKDW
ncbi:hypothetical protein AcV5_005483 [Taiwanofungus camphoratus]|nr:hypothetical protein AcV5_005483 [Antrodia cinnamomea]